MALIITLIALGLVLLLLELFIIPGFGITGILGFASLAGGVVMAYVSYGVMTGHIVLVGALVISGLIVWLLLRSRTLDRLALHENITAQAIDSAEEKGLIIGMQGIAVTRLAPMGTVKFDEIETEAVAFEGIIDAQQQVVIIKIEGAKVIVKTK